MIGLRYDDFQDFTVSFVKETIRQFNKFQYLKGIAEIKNMRLLGFWMIKSWGGKLNSPEDLISDQALTEGVDPPKKIGRIIDARANTI